MLNIVAYFSSAHWISCLVQGHISLIRLCLLHTNSFHYYWTGKILDLPRFKRRNQRLSSTSDIQEQGKPLLWNLARVPCRRCPPHKDRFILSCGAETTSSCLCKTTVWLQCLFPRLIRRNDPWLSLLGKLPPGGSSSCEEWSRQLRRWAGLVYLARWLDGKRAIFSLKRRENKYGGLPSCESVGEEGDTYLQLFIAPASKQPNKRTAVKQESFNVQFLKRQTQRYRRWVSFTIRDHIWLGRWLTSLIKYTQNWNVFGLRFGNNFTQKKCLYVA